MELGVSKGEVVATAKNAIFRTWTRRSYPSVRDTGTRIVYKHFIRFIMAGRCPAKADTSEVFLGYCGSQCLHGTEHRGQGEGTEVSRQTRPGTAKRFQHRRHFGNVRGTASWCTSNVVAS